MLDETKKLIGTVFNFSPRSNDMYKMWYDKDYTMAISEEVGTGKVEFNLDYLHHYEDKYWISEEDGLRRLKLKAFW